MPAGTDDADVERLNREYCAAYNAGEVEKLVAFLAEDAMTLSPDQPPVRGREAHRKYFAAGLAREAKRELKLTSIRHQRAGELLYDGGEWSNTIESPSSPGSPSSRTISGYYLTVYRREGNGWKAIVTTFNMRSSF
jgi:ketosteroid isomerase-like protein